MFASPCNTAIVPKVALNVLCTLCCRNEITIFLGSFPSQKHWRLHLHVVKRHAQTQGAAPYCRHAAMSFRYC